MRAGEEVGEDEGGMRKVEEDKKKGERKREEQGEKDEENKNKGAE